jgi:hypothetical protein
VEALDAAARTALAAHWTRTAQMEHASIAAFARFTLQLLGLGAPAELLAASIDAQSDELRHARRCFGVASRYAGTELGPGELDVEGSFTETSLVEVAILALREGCVGETVAAVEAAEAAAHAADPEIRELLRAIGEDETRHAELAFRFVCWVVEQLVPGSFQAALLAAEMRQCCSCVDHGILATGDDWMLRHGVLPAARRVLLRAQVIEHVVKPCLEALERRLSRSRAPKDRPARATA